MTVTKKQKEIRSDYIDTKFDKTNENWALTCRQATEEWFEFCRRSSLDMTGDEIQINKAHLNDFEEWLRDNFDYSSGSRKNKVMAVRDFLRYANARYGWEVLLNKGRENSVYNAEVKNQSKSRYEQETGEEIPYVKREEHQKMLEETNSFRDELILRILWDTGARPVEICNATRDHWSYSDQKISVQTAKRDDHERDLYLSALTNRKIGEWFNRGKRDAFCSNSYDSDYILVTQRNPQMDPDKINDIVKQCADDAKVQETAYTLNTENKIPNQDGSMRTETVEREYVRINSKSYRHSFCVRAVKNGISLPELAELVGHSGTDSLQHYLKFADDDKREAWERYTT